MRFIGKALEYLNAKGHDDRRLSLQVSPELVHVGDLIRHPLFPNRSIYVVAREVDFVDRCVNVWLDELPGANLHENDEPAAGAAAADTPHPAGEPGIGERP
jgi:hypothetical protein